MINSSIIKTIQCNASKDGKGIALVKECSSIQEFTKLTEKEGYKIESTPRVIDYNRKK